MCGINKEMGWLFSIWDSFNKQDSPVEIVQCIYCDSHMVEMKSVLNVTLSSKE